MMDSKQDINDNMHVQTTCQVTPGEPGDSLQTHKLQENEGGSQHSHLSGRTQGGKIEETKSSTAILTAMEAGYQSSMVNLAMGHSPDTRPADQGSNTQSVGLSDAKNFAQKVATKTSKQSELQGNSTVPECNLQINDSPKQE